MLRNFIFLVLVLIGTSSLQAQQRIDFEGNKAFSTGDLLEQFNSCITKSPDPDGENAERIRDYCLQMDVQKLMWSKGHLKAKVSAPIEQASDHGMKLMVSVDEGLRYRLGNVKITGSEIFTPAQLREKLNLKTGDVANANEIENWVFDRIAGLYGDLGFIHTLPDLDVTFRPDPDNPNEGLADLTVKVGEGRQYTIRRIEFSGNMHVKDSMLRSAMIRKEGDIYIGKLLDQSIKKLNEFGMFEFIDNEKDVKIMVDEETYDVDIIVRVTEKLKSVIK